MTWGSSCKVNNQAKRFKESFVLANENFQTEIDYNTFFNKGSRCCGNSGFGAKALSKATDYVERTFDCLSIVLEIPFIEDANSLKKVSTSSVENSLNLGSSIQPPILDILS